MAVFVLPVLKRVADGGLDAHGVVQLPSVLLDDAVHPQKAKAGDLTQLIRAVTQDLHALCPEELVNCQGRLRGYFERREHRHQVTEGAAFCIGLFDVLQPFFGNALDFEQTLRALFQDVKGIQTKSVYDGFRRPLPDPFEKARGQIPFDPVDRLWYDLSPLRNL